MIKILTIFMITIIILFSGNIGNNDTSGNNASNIDIKNLFISSDKSEIAQNIPADVKFTVLRYCGSEKEDVCLMIYPPQKIPAENVVVTVTSDDKEINKNITNKDGISIISINPPNSGKLLIKASKSGFNSALTYMTVNTNQLNNTNTINPTPRASNLHIIFIIMIFIILYGKYKKEQK